MLNKNNTIHLVYGREYQDSDDGGDFFFSYSTIFRNVSENSDFTFPKQQQNCEIASVTRRRI